MQFKAADSSPNDKSSYLQYLHELDDLKSQLSITKATAEASAASAKLAQLQCLSLLQNHDKHTSLNEYEFRVNKVGEQLDHLQKYLEGRELSQRQLKDVVLRTETEIMGANAKVRADKDNEPLRVLSGISPGNIEYINEHLNAKEDDIASLGDDVRVLFAHWKNKIKELKSQVLLLPTSLIQKEAFQLVRNVYTLISNLLFTYSWRSIAGLIRI